MKKLHDKALKAQKKTTSIKIKNIHQSGILIFREESVFFSSQSPKLTN